MRPITFIVGFVAGAVATLVALVLWDEFDRAAQ